MTSDSKTQAPQTNEARNGEENWRLRLYTAGQSAKSITAFTNLKKICEEHLQGQYSIDVIDLTVNPQLAKEDRILALPTLIRKIPEPMKRLIGDLSNTERVLVKLDIKPFAAR